MRRSTLSIFAAGALLAFQALAPARAGSFNCAVVYDEFESLMNKEFLKEPSQYVRTLPGRISKQQFDGVSNAKFHLYPSRDGMGIGILKTTDNVRAKFLFHWSQPMVDGTVHLILDEVVKYGRVADGYAPSRIGPFRLKPGMTIDVDTGEYIPLEDELIPEAERDRKKKSGDLQYESGDEGTILKAVNNAEVEFPLETMCKGEG